MLSQNTAAQWRVHAIKTTYFLFRHLGYKMGSVEAATRYRSRPEQIYVSLTLFY